MKLPTWLTWTGIKAGIHTRTAPKGLKAPALTKEARDVLNDLVSWHVGLNDHRNIKGRRFPVSLADSIAAQKFAMSLADGIAREDRERYLSYARAKRRGDIQYIG